jgi:hypothetical protein
VKIACLYSQKFIRNANFYSVETLMLAQVPSYHHLRALLAFHDSPVIQSSVLGGSGYLVLVICFNLMSVMEVCKIY